MPNNANHPVHLLERNGYFIENDLLSATDLQPLIRDIENEIDNSLINRRVSVDTMKAEDASFEKRLHKLETEIDNGFMIRKSVTGKHLKSAGLLDLANNKKLLDIVEGLVGPEILFHPQYNIQAKMPFEHQSQIPWHQDLWFLDREAERTPMVNLWIPLVNVTIENGCLEMIQGSHNLGLRKHQKLAGYPEDHIGISETELPPGNHVPCPIRKGGAVFFRHKTIHRSFPNRDDTIRWSIDIRYSDARKPTGRNVPGLLVRSQSSPGNVNASLSNWLRLMEDVPNQPYIC